MLAHFLGVLALIGSALLVIVGLGVMLFGLARGDRHLAQRAGIGTLAYLALYLLGIVLSVVLAPRQALPYGSELSFCGLDCHLHVSVVSSETEEEWVGVVVRVRSDAKGEPEYPQYLQFRLVGANDTLLVPQREERRFRKPLPAGQSYVDSLYFTAPPDGFPYSLRVIYPDLPERLLLGPANSVAAGKTTLSIQ